jgi:Protein of unknown function (DUF3307)
MLYFYLLLAHLVSDYLLQPSNLVEWKSKSKVGILTHTLIHFLFSTIILYMYTANLQVMILALLLASMHFLIDRGKALHDRKSQRTILSYWVDQGFHYLSIFLVSLIAWQFNGNFDARSINFGNPIENLFFNPAIIIYISVAIFFTLTIEYAHFKKGKSKKTNTLNAKNMIRRLFLVTLVYIGLLFALVPSMGVHLGG